MKIEYQIGWEWEDFLRNKNLDIIKSQLSQYHSLSVVPKEKMLQLMLYPATHNICSFLQIRPFVWLNNCVAMGKSLWQMYWHCQSFPVINMGINLSYDTDGYSKHMPQRTHGNELSNQLVWVLKWFWLTCDNSLGLNESIIPLHLVW